MQVALLGQDFEDIARLVGKEAVIWDHDRCAAAGINAGYPLGRDYPGMDDVLLIAVTERRTTDELDRLAEVLAR